MMQVMMPMEVHNVVPQHAPGKFSRFWIHVENIPEDLAYEVTDLQGNHANEEDATTVHDRFHFEIRFARPLYPNENPLVMLVELYPLDDGTVRPARREPLFKLDGHRDGKCHQFEPIRSVEGADTRLYQFHIGYNVFHEMRHGDEADISGVEFCVENTHINPERPELDPTWELRVDDNYYLSQAIPNCKGMPTQCPMNAMYLRETQPREWAQGDPAWYWWSSRQMIRDPATDIYYLLDAKEYDDNGGREKLTRMGGTAAYKAAGLFAAYGEKRFVSSAKTRMGNQLENAVRGAYCAQFPEVEVRESGMIDRDEPFEGLNRPAGMSPDGLIRDPGVVWDSIYKGRQEKWVAHWKEIGMSPKQIENLVADLPNRGLLEIKITNGIKEYRGKQTLFTEADMKDYYIAQVTWYMMVNDLYWCRLVKLNMNGGELRSYMIYRDFTRERRLLDTIIHIAAVMKEQGVDLALAAKTKEAKAFHNSLRASARWYNENRETCSTVLDTWGCKAVRGLFTFRRQVRKVLREGAVQSFKEKLVARLATLPPAQATLHAAAEALPPGQLKARLAERFGGKVEEPRKLDRLSVPVIIDDDDDDKDIMAEEEDEDVATEEPPPERRRKVEASYAELCELLDAGAGDDQVNNAIYDTIQQLFLLRRK